LIENGHDLAVKMLLVVFGILEKCYSDETPGGSLRSGSVVAPHFSGTY